MIGLWEGSPPETISSSQEFAIIGQVYHYEVKSGKQMIYTKNNYILDNQPQDQKYPSENIKLERLIIYPTTIQTIKIGNILSMRGRLNPIEEPTNPGQFHMRSYYQGKGISHMVFAKEIGYIDKQYSAYGEILRTLRESFGEVISLLMNDERRAGVLKAVLLGDKTDLQKDLKRLYEKNGISHILAISGLHISMIGLGLGKMLRKVQLSFKKASVLSVILMVSYGIMTGGGISTIRALCMFVLLLLGELAERTYDLLTALSIAAIVVLFYNPYSLYQVGFLLSFGAVLGIAILYPVLCDIWEVKHGIIKSMLMSVSIQLMTLPFVLYFFFEISIYGIFLNLVVIPLMTVVLISGLSAGMAGLCSVIIGRIFILPCKWILSAYEYLCMICIRLPFSQVVLGQPKVWQMCLYYFWMVVFLLSWKLCKSKRVKRIKALCCIFILMTGCLIYRGQGNLKMVFLDVGQGDGIFIQTPSGHNILVDGGSTSIDKVGEYRIVPFLKSEGVTVLDYILITHEDADHINGVLELIEMAKGNKRDEFGGFQIKSLVLADTLDKSSYKKIEEKALKKKIPVIYMGRGDVIEDGKVRLDCIHPRKKWKGNAGNESSLVLLLSYGQIQVLLTGDVEGQGENELLQFIRESGDTNLKEIEVLKVSHHGSKNSTTAEFLEEVKPEISVISAGRDNRYGHPHKELLQRLETAGAEIYSTKLRGAVTIISNGTQLWVNTYCP
jgi:competence protein ComEC